MVCPACSKNLPASVRYCAYCGAAQPGSQSIFSGLPDRLLALPRPTLLLALTGGLLGGGAGGLLGGLLGSSVYGALLGGFGAGASAALGDALAASLMLREGAARFGTRLGALGGGLTLAGGLLASLALSLRAAQAPSLEALGALVLAGLAVDFPTVLAGALVGGVVGAVLGRYAALGGYHVARRPGAVLGAAGGWTAGSLVGGWIAGENFARLAGAGQVDGALWGAALQLVLGLLLLAGLARLLGRRQHP